MKIFRCVTLSRSGSYAVFNWLPYQFSSLKKHRLKVNNYTHIRSSDIDIVFERYADVGIPFEFRKVFKGGNEVPNLSKRKSYLIIILRDPFNLFASRCNQRHLKRQSKSKIKEIANMWKQHAKEFLGETNYFKDKICINYNEWFKNANYRKDISEKIGGRHSDRKINIMPKHGDGSSFVRQDKRYTKNAQKLDVLNRWPFFISKQKNEHRKKFIFVFKDQELVDLSHKIFGHIKGTEVLYR